MSDNYTPTSEEVRTGYAAGTYCSTGHQAAYAMTTLNDAQALFDRWLADHDREVWHEGHEAGMSNYSDARNGDGRHQIANPYEVSP